MLQGRRKLKIFEEATINELKTLGDQYHLMHCLSKTLGGTSCPPGPPVPAALMSMYLSTKTTSSATDLNFLLLTLVKHPM